MDASEKSQSNSNMERRVHIVFQVTAPYDMPCKRKYVSTIYDDDFMFNHAKRESRKLANLIYAELCAIDDVDCVVVYFNSD